MTRLFSEGFEMGDLLAFENYSLNAGGLTGEETRSGNYALQCFGVTSGSSYVEKSIDAKSEIYVRMGFYKAETITSYWQLNIYNDTTFMGSVRYSASDEEIWAYVGASKVDTESFILDPGWHLIEARFKVDGSSGVFSCKIDGTLIQEYTGDTLDVESTINKVMFWAHGQYSGHYSYIDDLAINDTNGASDNEWCGDGHIIAMTPNDDGDNIDFSGSDGDSVDNYALVDDIPADDDTTYVTGASVNDYDLYEFTASSLPAEQIITRVWVEATAKDADTGDISFLVKSGTTTEEDASDQTLTTSYARYKSDEHLLNPDDSASWQESDLDAIQAGIKVKS